MGESTGFRDLVKRRQRAGFVGRATRLTEFEDNLLLDSQDDRRRILFNVHGPAGVGKTFLAGRFREVARGRGMACASVDESSFDVIESLAALAEAFGRDQVELPRFTKRLKVFRQRRQELEGDPQLPAGAFVTRSAVQIGLAAAGTIPVVGPFAAAIDSAAAAQQIDRARAYVTQKLRGTDDVQLVLAPEKELTRLFLADLRKIAETRPVGLFFDTYEQTSAFLDPWLLQLLECRFGEPPLNMVITISGQKPLAANQWAPYGDLIADIPLQPFTDAEARELLAAHGIVDEPTIAVILELSGRLPVWVAALATSRPGTHTEVADPADSAVERFLKWETDPERRAIAIAASLPRRFNQDVLGALTSADEEPGALFDWLRQLPFVTETAGTWRYHDITRAPMLRQARTRSPRRWRELHERLAALHEGERDALTIPEDGRWTESEWQHHHIEATYHHLCRDPGTHLPKALDEAVTLTRYGPSLARRWADMLAAAGVDGDSRTVRDWGERLTSALTEGEDVGYLTCLLRTDLLSTGGRKQAYQRRAITHRRNQRYDQALHDFNAALDIDPHYANAIAGRGEAHHLAGDHQAALADFNRALELDPDYAWALAMRAQTRLVMNDETHALADLNRALDLDPDTPWVFALRGMAHHSLMDHSAALADFDRALELDPDLAGARAARGAVHDTMHNHAAALIDFDGAIELAPSSWMLLAGRGESHASAGNFPEALADFNRAIELKPDSAWSLTNRGGVRWSMGDRAGAIADLDRAVKVEPENVSAITERGIAHRIMGEHKKALADLNRAVDLDPASAWALAGRGETHLDMGNGLAALADLTRAAEMNPGNDWRHYQLSWAYLALDREDEWRSSLDEALTLLARGGDARSPSDEFDHVIYLAASKRWGDAVHQLESALAREHGFSQIIEFQQDLDQLLLRLPEARLDVEPFARLVREHLRPCIFCPATG